MIYAIPWGIAFFCLPIWRSKGDFWWLNWWFEPILASQSIQLSTSRDVGINHQKMELLLLAFLMNGGEQHAAGLDAHHRSGRQIRDGDAGLSDQLFRLIICVNTAQNRPFLVRTVIQSELQKLFGLLDGFAFEDLHGPEIGLENLAWFLSNSQES